MVSLPPMPAMTLALLFPVSVSINPEPVRFSKLDRVSVPAPPVFARRSREVHRNGPIEA